MGDELTIGGEEIVLAEFAGENPGDLFEGDGFNGVVRDGDGEETDFEWVIAIGVFVLDAAELNGFCELGMKFFAEFTGKCGPG